MRVKQEMGVRFTLTNMLNMHCELCLWRNNIDDVTHELNLVQSTLADVMVCLSLVMSMVEHRSFNTEWADVADAGHIVSLLFE